MLLLNPARFGAAPPVPTTWDPLYKGANITLTNGDLTANQGTSTQLVRATRSIPSGKRYWEVTVDSASNSAVLINAAGIVESAVAASVQMGGPGANLAIYTNTMVLYYNNAVVSNFADNLVSSHIFQFARDSATGKVWIGRVGTGWFNSGDPAAGTGEVYTLGAGTWYAGATPNWAANSSRICTANFGASAFSGLIPSGFSAHDA